MQLKSLCLAVFALGLPTIASATLFDGTEVGDTVTVPPFAYGGEKSFQTPLVFRRIEPYAPAAKILVPLADGGYREVPRSNRRFFVADADLTGSRMYLSVSADGTRFHGGLFNAEGNFDISGVVEAAGLRVTRSKRDAAAAGDFQCGSSGEHILNLPDVGPGSPLQHLALPKGATHSAVVSFDTDNELLNIKFDDDLTAATDYLAEMITGMSVFYSRDLSVTLQQGTSFLRAQTISGDDGYAQSSTASQLNEVGGRWLNTPELNGIDRAFVAFLSGKSASQFSAGGIAWVLSSGNYCNAKGTNQGGGQVSGHFSATQVFTFAGSSATNDVGIVGHEIGHNFGASHTHCADRNTGAATVSTNTIDQCYNNESGCYSGPVSCPTDNSVSGQGSLMSYCNFNAPSGADCQPNGGQVLREFHPAHELLLSARVSTNINNGCFAALDADVGPTLTAASPSSGSTTAMGGGTVGNTVSSNISFNRSGGSGSGTTSLVCTASAGTVSVASGGNQSIAVGGTVNPVVARFTLTSSAQTGTVSCTATPQGGSASNFSYNFTAQAGTGTGPTLTANSPANGSTTAMAGGDLGATTESQITFNRSGGANGGTTALQCVASNGTVSVVSGGNQTIAVGGSVNPVVARFTLSSSAQAGRINCTATPQGGSVAEFSYDFTAPAGSPGAPVGDCNADSFFRGGFEDNEDNCVAGN